MKWRLTCSFFCLNMRPSLITRFCFIDCGSNRLILLVFCGPRKSRKDIVACMIYCFKFLHGMFLVITVFILLISFTADMCSFGWLSFFPSSHLLTFFRQVFCDFLLVYLFYPVFWCMYPCFCQCIVTWFIICFWTNNFSFPLLYCRLNLWSSPPISLYIFDPCSTHGMILYQKVTSNFNLTSSAFPILFVLSD